ncbi:l-serine dehydratase [Ophiostoma piceae UAMH 11346]|uniref:L-serine ammonia-lyase n=1 Tax=Ophiostoma piceae (strain UAMH 11346) TaxID=1262450 RepID=S3CUK4_OPHP1|nr:l-serine dehydratase [Ophiostoma piceae UAMH 11346]
MGSVQTDTLELPQPWIETPCVHSSALSKIAGCNIYLKLDILQPSGSFKSRGIGNLMVRAVAKARAEYGPDANVRFFCSSGGNAGLACATAARQLGYPSSIVVPTATSDYMVAKVRALCDDVYQQGDNWAAADKYLRETVMPSPSDMQTGSSGSIYPVYVPPFDHPDIWDGASSIVEEVATQLNGAHPDAFVCSVGGGGLMCGLMDGIDRVYGVPKSADSPPITKILAVETKGADSLMASASAGQLVTLPGISSIATSLGCVRVAEQTYSWLKQRPTAIHPVVVSDAESVNAIVRFLDDTRLLAEPACGAALAPVYTPVALSSTAPLKTTTLLRQKLGADMSDVAWAEQNIVVVVCGGSNISLEILAEFRERFGV